MSERVSKGSPANCIKLHSMQFIASSRAFFLLLLAIMGPRPSMFRSSVFCPYRSRSVAVAEAVTVYVSVSVSVKIFSCAGRAFTLFVVYVFPCCFLI